MSDLCYFSKDQMKFEVVDVIPMEAEVLKETIEEIPISHEGFKCN